MAVRDDSDLVAGLAVHFALDEASGSKTARHRHEMGWSTHGGIEPLSILLGHPARLVSLQWQLTIGHSSERLLVRVLGPIQVFKHDYFLDGCQLTKNLVRDDVYCITFHFLHIGQGKVERCGSVEGVKRQDDLGFFCGCRGVVFS